MIGPRRSSAPDGDLHIVSFRGSIVGSKWDRGWPFDRLVIHGQRVTLSGVHGEVDEFARDDIVRIEVERVRIPLLWRTTFCFKRTDGDPSPMFIPYRASKLAVTLEGLGWPVVRCGGRPDQRRAGHGAPDVT